MSKVRTLFWILALLAVFADSAGTITPKTPVTLDGCYFITSKEELYGFAEIVNGSENVAPKQTACARIGKSIFVNEGVLNSDGELNVADTAEFIPWTPIKNYRGSFDGQGYRIMGLYFNDTSSVNVGLFSNIVAEENDTDVSVKNVRIMNSYLRGKSSVGLIAGNVYATGEAPVIIYNVRNDSRIEAKGNTAGGIVALATGNVQIGNSVNTGYVAASHIVGGIVGRYVGKVENFKYANLYFQAGEYGDTYGIEVPEKMMNDGTVAYLLHDYYYEGLDASIWGQDVGEDPAPDFSKKITGDMPQVFEKLILHTYEGDASVLPENYVPGYRYDLPSVFREDYAFSGWYDNAQFKGYPTKFISSVMSGEQEFWAKFTPVYKISYQTGSGTVNIDDEVLSYVEGVGVVLPKNVTRSGAIFRGWYKDKNFKGERLFEIDAEESGDVVLYAKWLVKTEPSKNSDGCYVIKDESDLYGFAAIVNGTDGFSKNTSPCAYLDDDIVVNENVLNQDGTLNVADSAGFARWEPINGFNGEFDGRGHSISGLYVKCDSVRNYSETFRGYGFFGSVGVLGAEKYPVTVKNVGIEASYFETKGDYDKVGALVGIANGGGPSDSYIEISNSYSTSTVNAVSYPGGIVGVIGPYSDVVVENCYNTGSIEGKHNKAGGLVGSVDYHANVNIANCYNVGTVVSYGAQRDEDALVGEVKSDFDMTNCYYLKVTAAKVLYGSAAEMEQFENGDVAYALHNAENGSIWGQNVGVDPLPNFSGEIKNYPPEESSSSVTESSSSSVSNSSSSEAKSSSSVEAKSSSSDAKSSSSANTSSSSNEAKSSSSGSVKSSSSGSGFILYCKGKKCSEAVLEKWEAPRFHVMVVGRNVQVTGAHNRSAYALLDMQGRVLTTGCVDGSGFSIEMPYSGNFLVRVDQEIRRISVK